MTKLLPVILSGGSGTRLWPLSRELFPKQFIPFGGDTLFGKTLERASSLPNTSEIMVVCNEQHRFFAAGIAREKDCPAQIILERAPRNTAPAIAFAALQAMEKGEDPLLLVLPSDHSLSPQEGFNAAVAAALKGAEDGFLVTFGIAPSRPETGYGYILQGETLPWGGRKVARFVEKPDCKAALAMLENGEFLWNSGIFLFTASRFLAELSSFAPDMLDAVHRTWGTHTKDGNFTRFDRETFASIPAESIDYAVMEKTRRAAVMHLPGKWNDLGSWGAFYDEVPHDEDGNAALGDVVLRNAKDCYVHSSHRLVAAMNLTGVAVVETADAVLVMDREKTQDVKTLLAGLKKAERPEANTHLTAYRPWGSYQILAQGDRFQVKSIIVNPGGILSRQYHHHRAEHWIVVRGTAHITNGDNTFLLGENQSTFIPLGVTHRLENPGVLPLELIEIQSGGYLGEDDIVRLEDIYGRM
ncbi:xanthan biosynthesis protein XanB [Deltaproteobacteria bacterium]|nr:xanthan biosynthesis protein XanB [Deltaproteobacteria bacterium]